jgi:Glutathione S-transferase, N-terminal domain
VKLYVCYGTFAPQGHPCGKAHQALTEAGHAPDVQKTYGCLGTDRLFAGRREVKRLTGTYKVPTLVLDDGTLIDGSAAIIEWAAANNAAASPSE